MQDVLQSLSHWINDPAAATIEPVVSQGFSGARVWRVEHDQQQFSLRRWPRSAGSPCRLGANLALQEHLAGDGLPVPKPILTSNGASIVFSDGQSWGLATWLPGHADYWDSPRPIKLQAALAALARIHNSAARMADGGPKCQRRTTPSPALLKRSNRLNDFVTGEFYQLETAVSRHGESSEVSLAREALSLIERTAPTQLEASWRWRRTSLPLQWCLRDVWHDHLLFTGDQVTGVIDFGAAAIDSPAGDVARLLGSLVGDDREGWRLGLEAYTAVRPLSPLELDAVPFFDASGTVLSVANWLHWLYREPTALGENVDRPACLRRLKRLVTRLRTLAATSRS